MLQFEYLWAFLLLPLPIFVYWVLPAFKDKSEAVRVPFFNALSKVSPDKPASGSVVRTKNVWQTLHVMLSWSLIVCALAKPTLVDEPVTKEVKARDMLLVVDLSGSMEERDFTLADGTNISRLEAVKQVLTDFIERRTGDRIGLAVFGEAAFPQASFSEDLDTVSALVSELQPNMAGPKTMIGDAVGLSIRLFEASEKEHKLAILLTDGNDSGSRMPVQKAAQIASEKGIVFHTVAIGNPETTGEKALDLSMLESISDKTGGEFFLALDTAELETIYQTLDRIEPELIDIISYRPKQEYFYLPVAIMLALNMMFVLMLLVVKSQGLQGKDGVVQRLKGDRHA